MFMRHWLTSAFAAVAALIVGLAVSACGSTSTPQDVTAIRHVFVITLENEGYATTFSSTTQAPYLANTLASQGALVQQYYGTGHVSLDNYISMISGQSPTVDTDNDCTTYEDMTTTGTTTDGQVIGTGCVYPASVKTLPDQLTAAGFTWKGYEEDMGNNPTRESATCGHPTLNTTDATQTAEAATQTYPADMYATRHDPFMYFHSIIDSPDCATNVVNLTNLQTDLQSVATTPNFSFITPNLCDDGHDTDCVNGDPGGLTSANTFLQKWVPLITSSPAFQKDGLLIINFDESSYASAPVITDTSESYTFTGTTCCSEQPGPNLAAYPQTSSLVYDGFTVNLTKTNYGGDQTGAVMISKFIKPGTVSTVPYNHYSMLRTIETIFGVGYLGYAGQSGLATMGTDIFTNLH
ncbi:alkaline phosphatase family protein [Pararobbsia silviterrae]|uniref:Phosphoesterase n=1 Tax=Pararobbsia silviterrae TaxID=1792498 RepID=A0A494XG00_9BURK|nr:alkaline phosphatase family protein [Pararobbsia silviterrae]RKP49685.1 phosphoesterase [Pararobbsia silviterrae]